jgi:hypothetical protein
MRSGYFLKRSDLYVKSLDIDTNLIKYTLAALLLFSSQLVNAVATYQLTDTHVIMDQWIYDNLGNAEQVTASKSWPIPADVIGEKWNQFLTTKCIVI